MKILKKQIYVVTLSLLLILSVFIFSNSTIAKTSISRDTDSSIEEPPTTILTDIEDQEIEIKGNTGDEIKNSVSSATFFHKELNYSFQYPTDWLLGTYNSNGYEAVGLWDSVAQQQRIEGDLVQGVKIEITACDCTPTTTLKNTILINSKLTPETIIDISELPFDFYRDGLVVLAIKTKFKTEHGGGNGIYFIGRDGNFYTLTLGSPDFKTITERQLKDYELIFEDIVQSFTFN